MYINENGIQNLFPPLQSRIEMSGGWGEWGGGYGYQL